MTLPMLDVFKSDVARLDLSLISCNPSQENTVDGRRVWKPNEFLKLKVRVTNLSCKFSLDLNAGSRSQINSLASAIPLSLTLDLEPSDSLIYEGVISDIPVGRLDEGMTRVIELPICFLTNGHFELTAQAQAVGLDIKSVKAGITATVRS
jgi:hypothetical protein